MFKKSSLRSLKHNKRVHSYCLTVKIIITKINMTCFQIQYESYIIVHYSIESTIQSSQSCIFFLATLQTDVHLSAQC